MKPAKLFRKCLKICCLTVLGLILTVCAAVNVLYSSWGQEGLRQFLVNNLDSDELSLKLEEINLRFPLKITLTGVDLKMAGGEKITAGKLYADISPWGFLKMHANISEAYLTDATMTIGSADSAMYLAMQAPRLDLSNASVALATMSINIEAAGLNKGRVSMLLNPDTTAVDTLAQTPPTDMKIRLGSLALNDFEYSMRMLPTIDSLGAKIPWGEVKNLDINLLKQNIALKSFLGEGLGVSYLVPDSANIAATPIIPPSSAPAPEPWTIAIDTIGFTHSQALYATQGIVPAEGIDFAYIQVDSLTLGIKDFYNRATKVEVPMRVSGQERCGVGIFATGTLNVDSTATTLNDFQVFTALGSQIDFNATLGMGDLTTDPSTALALKADAQINPADLELLFPMGAPYLAAVPRRPGIFLTADVCGTAGHLLVDDLSLALGTMARLKAYGSVDNAFDPTNIGGRLTLDGSLIDLNPLKNAILDKATASEVNIPRTTLKGHAIMTAGNLKADLQGITDQGKLNLDADWHQTAEKYVVNASFDHFPINAFLPTMGIGEITANLNAEGTHYDLFSPSTAINASVAVDQAIYEGYNYNGIKLQAQLAGGEADIELKSTNPNLLADITAHGNLAGDTFLWQADIDSRRIDLEKLGFSPSTSVITANASANASITPKTNDLSAKLALHSLTLTDDLGTTTISDVLAFLNTTDSTTNASVRNGDLMAFLSSEMPLDSIMSRLTATSAEIDTLMARREINVEKIQRCLPQFNFSLQGGPNNAITDFLADSRSSLRSLSITADNDSSLSVNARVLGYTTPSMRLDTISFDLAQYGPRLVFDAGIDNRPGTFDQWAHVRLDGFLADNRLGIELTQNDIKGKQGYNLGFDVALADSTATLAITTLSPTIAYMPWTVNDDNFITWNFPHRHLDANLQMKSASAASSLSILTQHVAGQDDNQEELLVNISQIKLADWIKLNPLAPEIDGLLTTNLSIRQDGHLLTGKGIVELTDLTYGRRRVGSFDTDINVATDPTGMLRADVAMDVDGHRCMELKGALNDSTASSPLALDLNLIKLPLNVVNPFIPDGMATLRGSLVGKMDVTGSAAAPRLDGWLRFDSTAVNVKMMAQDYAFNNVEIPVDSNLVRFNDFSITGVNENPLSVNGYVNLADFSKMDMDLKLNAQNMQICNSKKAQRGAEIYGKGFISLDASIKGNTDFMAINAAMSVLSGTNITYMMTDAVSTFTQQTAEGLVTFVNFADSAAVQVADSLQNSSMAMLLESTLTIQSGSTINVDLSANGRNKVSIQPDGIVDFSMQPFGTPRLTGRINLPKGFVRYTPPLLSEKLFNLQPNSYVAFNGNMMNPQLNLHAVDVLKANVTQTGQNSRMVNFDVSLAVTGTLENMNVAFDLSTDDDITVANELQSMSPEQRANQAMNMLLYNIYSGPGTRGDSNLSGNALYSFLSSQLNNWAASAIKGVDISFGIDQYDRTVGGATSQTTSYSYQVSKSLFNDRFKIVVGGNYSTDANADENFSQNLIKDISFDYYINKAQTMYVRLFRHTGYESILEGEITKTGVGFVYKRKLGNLRNIFGKRLFSRRKKSKSSGK